MTGGALSTGAREMAPQKSKRVKKPRDHANEYAHRIEEALSRGLSRSQGRGHPKATEALVSAKPPKPLSDEKLQHALGVLRQGKNLAKAAKSIGVSPERLRRIAVNKGAITKEDQGWIVRPDLPRRMPLYSRGREIAIVVGDFDTASLIGRYMSAVGQFLTSNNRALLMPFAGQSATDVKGKAHPFEVNPNALYRLASAGGDSFEQVYRIIV
jgi:hypothetical protein